MQYIIVFLPTASLTPFPLSFSHIIVTVTLAAWVCFAKFFESVPYLKGLEDVVELVDACIKIISGQKVADTGPELVNLMKQVLR